MVRRFSILLIFSVGGAGALAYASDEDVREPSAAAAAPASQTRAPGIAVEIALTAGEARWRPARTKRGGTLTLNRIAPRMAVMAAAPRREVAIMPASLLGANWKRLFKDSGGSTNAVVSAVIRGRPRLVPVRLRLEKRHASGKRFVFRVTPLKRTAHRMDRLGSKRVTLENPTLLIDPMVTDAIKAMWEALRSIFGGERFDYPPNPSSPTADGGIQYESGGVYDGPDRSTIATPEDYFAVERGILDAAGPWSGTLAEDGDLTFNGSTYDGLALFSGPGYGDIAFAGAGGRIVLTNTALFELQAQSVSFENADVGGANLRSLNAGQLTVSNSVFQNADMTGAVLGSALGAETRNTISNSAFVDVTADRVVNDADGNPDRATRGFQENGQGLLISNTDFTSVTFQDVSFPEGVFTGTTFQGCGFQNMDFSGATFDGGLPSSNDGRFTPTFDNSVMEGVSFDNARLRNVSFAGVDFTGGNVSFEGARLNNVDFTGAVGLQFIDWSNVTVEGNVYGLEAYGHLIGDLQDPEYLRSITFDGEVPRIDAETGFDIQPGTEFLIDTETGVRLERTSFGQFVPVDPFTGEPLRDPTTGDQLIFEPGGVFNPETQEEFSVDYATGELEGR